MTPPGASPAPATRDASAVRGEAAARSAHVETQLARLREGLRLAEMARALFAARPADPEPAEAAAADEAPGLARTNRRGKHVHIRCPWGCREHRSDRLKWHCLSKHQGDRLHPAWKRTFTMGRAEGGLFKTAPLGKIAASAPHTGAAASADAAFAAAAAAASAASVAAAAIAAMNCSAMRARDLVLPF